MIDKLFTIALIPLDERPVNTRYPQMLGAIGGADVLLPPAEIRGLRRISANVEAVANWLQEAAKQADAAIVSCEYLGSGNLIASRISQDNAATILTRLNLLGTLNPTCPIHAFSLITRVSNADDAVEEPEYWAEWGTKFYRYAYLAHQAEQGNLADLTELTALAQLLPPELKTDWLVRRLRNHTVNLGLLEMAARGQITSLRLTSDDTSPLGFPSRERRWLSGWPPLIGPALTERVMMHPGADEVGSALLAKLLLERAGTVPRVWIVYSHPGGEELIAPYEDRPVRETVEGQIRACGGVPAENPYDCDLVLGVATPVPGRSSYKPEYLSGDQACRAPEYHAFLDTLGEHQKEGMPFALADVAYPNGSDPLLMAMLLTENAHLDLGELAAYGAWNTAGNTLGVVIAQAFCAGLIAGDPDRALAQKRFLTHRFLEDWGYQAVIRREARVESECRWGHPEPSPGSPDEQVRLSALIEDRLNQHLHILQAHGVGAGLQIVPRSTHLPWKRTFEIDFILA